MRVATIFKVNANSVTYRNTDLQMVEAQFEDIQEIDYRGAMLLGYLVMVFKDGSRITMKHNNEEKELLNQRYKGTK
ncbi:MAG: hypothetical protein K0U41_08885 [Gammaproteobacteria bacterium]|nr:hypothetical protein [Gammaproteobacteria bacterium]